MVDDDFAHKLGTANIFIIESNISTLAAIIETIAKTNFYDSRANFILYQTDEVAAEMSSKSTIFSSFDVSNVIQSLIQEIKSKNNSVNGPHNNSVNNAVVDADSMEYIDNITKPVDHNKTNEKNKFHYRTLVRTFEILWAHHIFNAIVLLCDSTSTRICSLYTWFPFDEQSKCGKKVERFVKIDECEYNKKTNYFHFHYGEENKLYFNMNNISIKKYYNGQPSNVNHTFVDGNQNTFEMNFNNKSASNLNQEIYEMGKYDNNSKITETIVNLYNLNEMNPFIELTILNNTRTSSVRERDQNQILARKYFKYDYREFGLIEFRRRNTKVVTKSTLWASHLEERTILNRHFPHFYNKIPNDLHGCAYNALAIIWPPFVTPKSATFYGMEHKLLLDVSRYMNFQIVEQYTELSMVLSGGQRSSNLYESLTKSSATFAFGNIYPDINMLKHVDASIGYLYDNVNWVVPLATALPAWLNLFNCFR